MEAGKVSIGVPRIYMRMKRAADGKPVPIPAQAEIVRELYTRYLAGASLRELKDWLEHGKQPTVAGGTAWSITAVKGILTNEKYCGDVLLQKTFSTDVISKKVVKNTGQLPKYLVQNHHEGIVTREQFQAVQAELARRSALRSDSKQAATGRSCYTSKYALSDRLVCGECGKLYRRKTRNIKGNIYHEWRCISRLDYGKRYCHDSPTLREIPLQNAILAAINAAMSEKPVLLDRIKSAMSLELLPVQGQTMSLADINRRLEQLDARFQQLLAEAIDAEDKEICNTKFAEILAEQTGLKMQKEHVLQNSTDAKRTWCPPGTGRAGVRTSSAYGHGMERTHRPPARRARDRPVCQRGAGSAQGRERDSRKIGVIRWSNATGDLHGNSLRFQPQYFPEQAEMTKDDYMIVCGDFGCVWNGDKTDDVQLDRLEALPFTVLFVDGNHENFDALNEYPIEQWRGGTVHEYAARSPSDARAGIRAARQNVLHNGRCAEP